jgi:glutamine---fructose-6-phosphate transaminase (isomerizing)
MKLLFSELEEIPLRARECYGKNKTLTLPKNVPYLGQGASYYAALVLYYCNAPIRPYIASEYHAYFAKKIHSQAVCISQSGQTSEVLWNLKNFKKIICITNNPNSTLAQFSKTQKTILLSAQTEKYLSATKTYINTLISLYLGFHINPLSAIKKLETSMEQFNQEGKKHAQSIFDYTKKYSLNGLYVVGSGPNIATANEAALVLTETTRLSCTGLAMSQFDHGPKEASNNSVIIFLNAKSKDTKRQKTIIQMLNKKTNALILTLSEDDLNETLSPVTLTTQVFYIMYHLVKYLNVSQKQFLGGKITLTKT